MNLVIVESPSKSKTIQKYLGNNYKVMATVGHIYDLPKRSLGIDIDNNFEPQYVITDAKKRKIINDLKTAVKSSDKIYLATDPDREGEAISWHIAKALEIENKKNRIEFHEITYNAINNAINNPREINQNLVDAQQARRVIDRLVGYKVSPILSSKIKAGLSGGRVQSAALKMIIDREKDIESFTPREYWNIVATLKNKSGIKIQATATECNGKKITVANKSESDTVIQELLLSDWNVSNIKKSKQVVKAFPPYTTSTLQQDASIKLGYSSSIVMQIAQQLYEGVEVAGEGHIALVTYIRTDSVRVSKEMQDKTLDYIKTNYGLEFTPSKPNVYSSKKIAQDAHEAIRPVDLNRTPESLKGLIKSSHYKLYKLIYERYLASQMTPAVYAVTNIEIEAIHKQNIYSFGVQEKKLIEKGYTIVYDSQTVEEEDDGSPTVSLPDLSKDEKFLLEDVKGVQKFTKPLSRYTEASLIKSMEENGIGRPSTYASVISVLLKRDYVKKEKKVLVPSILGRKVTEYMESYFPDIVDLKFTANMEDALDTIENGKEWKNIISKFYPKFAKDVDHAKKYSQKVELPQEVSDEICEKCGANMIVKDGRYGKFLACPNYPSCKNVKSINEKVSICPICGNDVVKRHTKKGKMFYACVKRECKFMSWDLPAPILCPKCSSPMKINKVRGKTQYVCTDRLCRNIVLPLIEGSESDES